MLPALEMDVAGGEGRRAEDSRLGRGSAPRRTGVTGTGRSRRAPSSRQGKQRQVGGDPNAGAADGDGVGDLLAGP